MNELWLNSDWVVVSFQFILESLIFKALDEVKELKLTVKEFMFLKTKCGKF